MQVTDLLAGLDYAFPEATKIGGFVSAATHTAKRGLWCWSAAHEQQTESGVVQVIHHHHVPL